MKGFTLIELIVTITIIVIITVSGLVSYFVFDSKQKTLNEARDFVSLLDKARSSAMTLEYPATCTGLRSYRVSDGDSAGYLKVEAVCASGTVLVEEKKIFQATDPDINVDVSFLAQTGFLESGVELVIRLTSRDTGSVSRTVTIDPYIVDNIAISSE